MTKRRPIYALIALTGLGLTARAQDGAGEKPKTQGDPNATSSYNGKQGAFIDPQQGTRWLPGQIPAGSPKIPTPR